MGKRVTNINDGGKVGIQSADTDDNTDTAYEGDSEVTNINNKGTVGIQGANTSNNTVIMGR